MAATENRRSFSSTTPRFFAIVHDYTLLNNNIIIPNKIVTKCGSSLGDDVLLKLPCGSEWKLGLTRTGEGLVLIDKGWIEFSKHYSMGMGHFLVLSYEGNSRFSVLIFDTTRNEIDYPLKNRNDRETTNHDKYVKEEGREAENGGDEDGNNPFQPRKRMRKGRLDGGFRDLGGEGASPDSRSKAKHKVPEPRTSPSQKSESTHDAKRKTSGFGGSFQSEKPSFAVYMWRLYMHRGCHLRIPANFARTYMGRNQCEIRFCVPEGRSWSVQYRMFQGKRSQFEISKGWSAFKRENGLEEGDICMFELRNKAEMSFNVRIMKPTHEGYEQMRKRSKHCT